MNNMWKKCKLSDIGNIVGGATPSTKEEEYYGGEIPWLTPKDLSSYHERYITNGERNITEEGLRSCSAQLLPSGSVLFSSRAPIGYVAIAKNPIATNQGFKSVIPNENTDSLFLYYLLKYNKEKIDSMGSGTTFKEVSGATMKNIKVTIPSSLYIQKRIANILGSIDDKIELNNRINANLEEQAQALFRRWFVDFEFPNEEGLPYKSNGGKFVDSELGKIPEGWKIGTLSEIADYLNGLAMQKFRPQDKELGIPVLKIKELGQKNCDSSSDICSESIKPEYIVNDGDVIFSWSGTLKIDIWCGGICGLNQHLFKVTSKIYPKWFYYYWTKQHLNKFIRIAKDKAVTMGHIKREDLDKSQLSIPNNKNFRTMNNIIGPLLEKQITLNIENRFLIQLCDAILPKLMNNEIKI